MHETVPERKTMETWNGTVFSMNKETNMADKNNTDTYFGGGENESDYTDWSYGNNSSFVDITRTNFGLASILVESAVFCVTVAALILNGLVFSAVSKRPEEKLRVKFLLQNSIFADIVLALSIGTRITLTVLAKTGLDPATTNLCGKLFYMTVGYFSAFYQVISSWVVSLDRLYSICQPLSYHSFKYNRSMKVVVIGLIFSLSLGLCLPIIFLRYTPGQTLYAACISAFGQSLWSESVLPFLLLSGVCLTVLTYVSIFLIIVCYRRRSRDNLSKQVGREKSEKADQQKSLSITFFLIHLTYVILYVPSLLFFSFLGQHLDYQPELNFFLSQFLITIYLLNAFVDPLVYIFRISFVRARFRALCCSGSSYQHSVDSFTGKTVESMYTSQNQVKATAVSEEKF